MEPSGKNWVCAIHCPSAASPPKLTHLAQATEYLIDPLSAPQPSEEDGPGSSFRHSPATATETVTPTKSASMRSSQGNRLSKNNPYRKSLGSPQASNAGGIARSTSLKNPSTSYPSPPPSAGPRSPNFRHDDSGAPRTHRRRGSSLNEKYPGDMSHRPLDQLSKEKRVADRSRHVTRKHHIQPDTIDSLDTITGSAYHHGGPYDATLYARNNSSSGPLGALVDSNNETLKATPREKVIDSVRGHRPLDGVATYESGQTDPNGHLYTYEQGDNMMIEGNPAGGAYKRWPGVQYHPDDIKGKGEPSYTIEKALKEHGPYEKHGGKYSDRDHNADPAQPGSAGIEMKSTGFSSPTGHNAHRRNISSSSAGAMASSGAFDDAGDGHAKVGRSGSLSKGLKKRWGSVKRHMHRDSE